MSGGFIGKVFLARQGGTAPGSGAYTRILSVLSQPAFGETADLENVTTFGEASKTFIAGLREGAELTLRGLYDRVNAPDFQASLIADVQAGANRNYRMEIDQGSPSVFFAFSAVPISWQIVPSLEGRNEVEFRAKITGAISLPA